jgi:hypothetical protein
MKTKFKKNGKRLLAAVLCLVMAVMALPMSAFAWTSEEGVSCTSSFGDYYVGSDGEYYRSKSSYSFIVYDSDGNTSVRTISAGNAKRKLKTKAPTSIMSRQTAPTVQRGLLPTALLRIL